MVGVLQWFQGGSNYPANRREIWIHRCIEEESEFPLQKLCLATVTNLTHLLVMLNISLPLQTR